ILLHALPRARAPVVPLPGPPPGVVPASDEPSRDAGAVVAKKAQSVRA
ncbi:MAG: hypothetical protein IAI49_14005, partial [Candidatus Eremiobacteraeota bacterium]|nr:hypothetical protein [Candidatus Eremiobacteraeota bacterium]